MIKLDLWDIVTAKKVGDRNIRDSLEPLNADHLKEAQNKGPSDEAGKADNTVLNDQ